MELGNPEMINNPDRADVILAAWDALPEPKDGIQVMLIDVMDLGLNDKTPVHRLIRDSFQSDDDFDDLRHEIDHATGECSDDDPDCIWADGDDD